MSTAVVAATGQSRGDSAHERFLISIWLLFLSRNAAPAPDDDGHFYVGVIDDVPPKTWCRDTPYSIATKKP